MAYLFQRLLTCLVTTLVLELIFAALLGIRQKRHFAVIALINCATNPLVVYTLALVSYLDIPALMMPALLCLELFAVLSEGFLYRRVQIERPFLTSFILNVASYFGGILIRRFIFFL